MHIIPTPLSDLFVLEPKIFRDARGYFFESFNQKKLESAGLGYKFVQDNESQSAYGTLRGLHFQKGPFAQAKLVRAIKGEILDVAVDLREGSNTFGQHFSVLLTGENKKMLMIPRGFAHGFVVLSETAVFAYKCDNYYSPENEGGLHFADPDLNIDWQIDHAKILLSDKDKKNPSLKQFRQSGQQTQSIIPAPARS